MLCSCGCLQGAGGAKRRSSSVEDASSSRMSELASNGQATHLATPPPTSRTSSLLQLFQRKGRKHFGKQQRSRSPMQAERSKYPVEISTTYPYIAKRSRSFLKRANSILLTLQLDYLIMHTWYHHYYLLTIIPNTGFDINKLKCIPTTYDIMYINYSQDKRYLENVICSWTIPLSINCGWSQKTCFFIYTETETRVHICYFDLYSFPFSSRTGLHAT